MVLLQFAHDDYDYNGGGGGDDDDDDDDNDDDDDDEDNDNDKVVRTFNYDTDMEFGLDKCAKTVLKKGKLFHLQNLIQSNLSNLQLKGPPKKSN